MRGSIDYALGLSTTNFLGPLNMSNAALKGFTALAAGAGAVLAGAFTQINRGAALKDLSARTGESVGDLFRLQNAFSMVGLQAGNVSPVLLAIQRSLGGVNEAGEPTDQAFKRIGLDIDALKKLGGPELLKTLADALGKVDRSTATNIASKIAGRGGAGDLLQIAGSAESFAEAIVRSAQGAELFQRHAKAFDDIDDNLQIFRQNIGTGFGELAGALAPMLRDVTGALAGMDFQAMLKPITSVIATIPKAIEDQRLGELIGLTFTIGFGESLNFFSAGLQRIFAAIPDLWIAAVNGGLAGSLQILSKLTETTGGGALAAILPPGLAQTVQLLEKQTGGVSSGLGNLAGQFGRTSGEHFGRAWKAAVEAETVDIVDLSREHGKLGVLKNDLAGPLAGLNPNAAQNIASGLLPAGVQNLLGFSSGARKDVDALTRIGASLGGNGSAQDYARTTAGNTARTVAKLDTLIAAVKGLNPAGNFANV